jgi:hypothetical protein
METKQKRYAFDIILILVVSNADPLIPLATRLRSFTCTYGISDKCSVSSPNSALKINVARRMLSASVHLWYPRKYFDSS